MRGVAKRTFLRIYPHVLNYLLIPMAIPLLVIVPGCSSSLRTELETWTRKGNTYRKRQQAFLSLMVLNLQDEVIRVRDGRWLELYSSCAKTPCGNPNFIVSAQQKTDVTVWDYLRNNRRQPSEEIKFADTINLILCHL